MRELSEETGITAQTSDLVQLYEYADYRRHSIYHSYVYVTQPDTKVTLQEGETMNYRWLSYKEFVNWWNPTVLCRQNRSASARTGQSLKRS